MAIARALAHDADLILADETPRDIFITNRLLGQDYLGGMAQRLDAVTA